MDMGFRNRHGLEHVRWIKIAAVAGRMRRYRNAHFIKFLHNGSRCTVFKTHIQGIGQPRLLGTVYNDILYPGQNPLLEIVAQFTDTGHPGRKKIFCQCTGLAKTNYAGDIFSAGPVRHFLTRPHDERGERDRPPYIQGPDPFGTMELVSGHCKIINRQGCQIDRFLAHKLHRITMKQNIFLPAKSTDLS